jgi:hypothetical protein
MDERTAETADPREEIARLEEQIEQLEAKLESCQKFAAASRFAMALGGILLVGLVFGVIPFDPLALTGAMAAGLRRRRSRSGPTIAPPRRLRRN